MKNTEIIEALRSKPAVPGGRHLYGVLGSYAALAAFPRKLRQAKAPGGRRFPKPISVNRGILNAIPDNEFRQLVENEAKRPEPTAAHVAKAFEMLLRSKLRGKGLIVLSNLETLFAYYHIARTRNQGITPEDITNSVLVERDPESNADENNQHYETIADNLKKELRQIVKNFDEDKRPLYRFDPVFTEVDPRNKFWKARDEAESNEVMIREAWEHLLALAHYGDQIIDVNWQGRQVSGLVGMRDLGHIASKNLPLPAIASDQTDLDFSVFIGSRSVTQDIISRLLDRRKDPRTLLWTPGELTREEHALLLDFAAYRKLISDWQGKETEDAVAVVNWVSNTLQTEPGKIAKIVDNSYSRGRIDALNNSQMKFHVAGELSAILSPLVDRVLTSVYVSRDLTFNLPFVFRKEEGVKVMNGIVKSGSIHSREPDKRPLAPQAENRERAGLGLGLIRNGLSGAFRRIWGTFWT